MRHKGKHRGPVLTLNWSTSLEVKTRIAVGMGSRLKLANVLGQIGAGKRVLLLCQHSIAEHWLEEVVGVLPSDKFEVSTVEVPDGEEAKTPEWLLLIWEKLQEGKFDRHDTVVALGGGALSDLAGFAAATYLRGLNLVLIPTSLLAQVDAAIGGKTGINLKAGKNLAGSFYFPKAVLADQETLSSLPESQMISGLGEIYKYALIEETIAANSDYEIGPRRLWDILCQSASERFTFDDPTLQGIIISCIKMKLFVVGKDPHESGLRRCLNLGHTFGHAIEKVKQYQVTHGEAVAIGMVCATTLGVKREKIAGELLEQLKSTLVEAGLPIEIPPDLDKETLLASMAHDKKRQGESLRLIVPYTRLGLVDFDASYPISGLADLI